MPVYGPLTLGEHLFVERSALGLRTDLRSGDEEHDAPENASRWHPQRSVRAELIATVLTEGGAGARSGGVALTGARVVGDLHLSAISTTIPLSLIACSFAASIFLNHSTLSSLVLVGSHAPAVAAQLANITGIANLRDTRLGQLDLSVARVGGQLILRRAQLGVEGQTSPSLLLTDASAQSVVLNDAVVHGGADLTGAHVLGNLFAERATFDAPGSVAIDGIHLSIDRSFLASGLVARGDVMMADAKIRGQCGLPNTHIIGTMTLIGSEVGELILSSARLVGTRGRALRADRLTVDRAVFAEGGLRAEGQVRFVDARIQGTIDLSDATIDHRDGPALTAERMVAAGLMLHRATLAGGLAIPAAHITGQLTLTDTHIEADGDAVFAELLRLDHGLNAARMRATGDVSLSSVDIRGSCELAAARIEGTLWLERARLAALSMTAIEVVATSDVTLMADGMTVEQDVSARGASFLHGTASMIAATINGSLIFVEAHFQSAAGNALWADRVVVEGALRLGDAVFDGSVRLLGARVGRQFLARGARFRGTPTGLSADGLRVGSDCFLESMSSEGSVRCVGAQIDGQLSLDGAELTRPQSNLIADGIVVEEDASLEGLRARGAVSLTGARFKGQVKIGGRLLPTDGPALMLVRVTAEAECRIAGLYAEGDVVCADARFQGGLIIARSRVLGEVMGGGLATRALVLDGLVVRAGITDGAGAGTVTFFALVANEGFAAGHGFATDGSVEMMRARIGGQLSFGDAHIGERGGDLRLNDSEIRGAAYLDVHVRRGVVDLRGVTASVLDHPEPVWPQRLEVDGLGYERLEGETSRDTYLRWLELMDGYSPQPYQELAAFFRRSGRPEDARAVGIAQQRRRRRQLNRLGAAASRSLDWTVGYGFRPWLAALWLAAFLIPAIFIFDAEHPTDLKPTRDAARVPEFDPILYAVDVLVPVISLNHREAWAASGSAQTWVLVFTLAGWALTTALVAGLTGVLRRD